MKLQKPKGRQSKTKIIIPARLGSARLKNKVLVEIAGVPMLLRVLTQCSKATMRKNIYVATPDEKIYNLVNEWGYQAILTGEAPSGSARIASIIHKIKAKYIVNVQGDLPIIDPKLIRKMIRTVTLNKADVVTPVYKIRSSEDITDLTIAKVVLDKDGYAMYFSRSAIPHVRDEKKFDWPKKTDYWGHYGIYAYKRSVLRKLNKLVDSPHEKAEQLEQLRFLYNGLKVLTFETDDRQYSVDVLRDIEAVEKRLKKAKG